MTFLKRPTVKHCSYLWVADDDDAERNDEQTDSVDEDEVLVDVGDIWWRGTGNKRSHAIWCNRHQPVHKRRSGTKIVKLNSGANPLQPVAAPTSIGVTTFPENPMKLKKIESMGDGRSRQEVARCRPNFLKFAWKWRQIILLEPRSPVIIT